MQSLACENSSNSSVVSSDSCMSNAVGSTTSFESQIENVSVGALMDSGSQSTIISCANLQRVARHLHSNDKQLPKQVLPQVKVYGKDDKIGKTQTTLAFMADGVSTNVTIFVQPESEQDCLLSMNAIPNLGIQLLRSNGQPIYTIPEAESSVRLLQTSTIPGRKGRFLS